MGAVITGFAVFGDTGVDMGGDTNVYGCRVASNSGLVKTRGSGGCIGACWEQGFELLSVHALMQGA
jgi:hypothetical protein